MVYSFISSLKNLHLWNAIKMISHFCSCPILTWMCTY